MPRRIEVEAVLDTSQLERGFKRASRSANQFERSMERSGRGVAAATFHIRGLGRAAAFASTSFIGGYGLAYAIKSTIDEATQQTRVIANLKNAVRASGFSWAEYGRQIQATTKRTKELSAFDDEELYQSLQLLLRGTGSVTKALRLNALAANVARGRNMGLVQAAQLLVRVNAGQVGSLRRLGIQVDKNASGQQALASVQRQYAGAAAAYGRTAAGAQDRFRVAVQDLQKAIGRQLLPVITQYLNKGADWLNQSRNQEKILRNTKATITLLAEAFVALGKGIDAATTAYQSFRGAAAKLPGGKEGFLSKLVSGTLFAQVGDLIKRVRQLKAEIAGGGGGGGGVPPVSDQWWWTGTARPPAAAGGRPGYFPGGAPAATTAVSAYPQLTAAQRRAIALAGTPTMAALQAQRGYDERAIAFLNRRWREGYVSAKKYRDQMVGLKNDLAGINDQIAAMTKHVEKQKRATSAGLHLPGRLGGTMATPGLLHLPGTVRGSYQFFRAGYDTPARLQLAYSRADALGLGLRPILLKMREAAYRALHSGRLAVEAQTQAWDAIKSINDQLKQGADKAARSMRRQAVRTGRAYGAEYQFAYAAPGPRIHIEHFYSSASSPRALENELARRARARAHVRRGAR